MRAPKPIHLAILATFVLATRNAPAETVPVSGLYQILAGRYTECCGLAGADSGYDLPNPGQSYIKLTVDPQSGLASMAFLAADLQTVFSVAPCPPAGNIEFRFNYGFSYPGGIIFHVDPGPPPYSVSWSYSVSNSGPALRINGELGTAQSECADVPTRFGHSNVVAVLIPPPRLSLTGFSNKDGVQLMLQGHAGHTNVIEASTDLITWGSVATNVMDFSLCPICPYFLFQDPASTNLPRRFYRAFELW
jgi:hypothetical protein